MNLLSVSCIAHNNQMQLPPSASVKLDIVFGKHLKYQISFLPFIKAFLMLDNHWTLNICNVDMYIKTNNYLQHLWGWKYPGLFHHLFPARVIMSRVRLGWKMIKLQPMRYNIFFDWLYLTHLWFRCLDQILLLTRHFG